jgi:hypothetical protein
MFAFQGWLLTSLSRETRPTHEGYTHRLEASLYSVGMPCDEDNSTPADDAGTSGPFAFVERNRHGVNVLEAPSLPELFESVIESSEDGGVIANEHFIRALFDEVGFEPTEETAALGEVHEHATLVATN